MQYENDESKMGRLPASRGRSPYRETGVLKSSRSRSSCGRISSSSHSPIRNNGNTKLSLACRKRSLSSSRSRSNRVRRNYSSSRSPVRQNGASKQSPARRNSSSSSSRSRSTRGRRNYSSSRSPARKNGATKHSPARRNSTSSSSRSRSSRRRRNYSSSRSPVRQNGATKQSSTRRNSSSSSSRSRSNRGRRNYSSSRSPVRQNGASKQSPARKNSSSSSSRSRSNLGKRNFISSRSPVRKNGATKHSPARRNSSSSSSRSRSNRGRRNYSSSRSPVRNYGAAKQTSARRDSSSRSRSSRGRRNYRKNTSSLSRSSGVRGRNRSNSFQKESGSAKDTYSSSRSRSRSRLSKGLDITGNISKNYNQGVKKHLHRRSPDILENLTKKVRLIGGCSTVDQLSDRSISHPAFFVQLASFLLDLSCKTCRLMLTRSNEKNTEVQGMINIDKDVMDLICNECNVIFERWRSKQPDLKTTGCGENDLSNCENSMDFDVVPVLNDNNAHSNNESQLKSENVKEIGEHKIATQKRTRIIKANSPPMRGNPKLYKRKIGAVRAISDTLSQKTRKLLPESYYHKKKVISMSSDDENYIATVNPLKLDSVSAGFARSGNSLFMVGVAKYVTRNSSPISKGKVDNAHDKLVSDQEEMVSFGITLDNEGEILEPELRSRSPVHINMDPVGRQQFVLPESLPSVTPATRVYFEPTSQILDANETLQPKIVDIIRSPIRKTADIIKDREPEIADIVGTDAPEIAGSVNSPEPEITDIVDNPEPEIIDGVEFFEVEFIMKHRRKNAINEYFVRWRGYDSTFDTWEPEVNLEEGAEEVLRDYRKRLSKGRG